MKSLIRDERGSFILPLVGVIIGPLVVMVIAGSLISAIRTGAGITDSLTRSAHSQIIFGDLVKSVGAASIITVDSADRITVTTDPSVIPAAAAGAAVGASCATTTWELTGDDLRTLTQTTSVHRSDCASPVASERVEELTGLAAGTAFSFENLAGRTLTLTGTTLAPADEPKPAGVQTNQWSSPRIGAVILDGVVQEMFADRPVHITAVNTPGRKS